jgi:hypothetical protein
MNNKEHWEKVYGTNAQNAVSWYAPHLETSWPPLVLKVLSNVVVWM